MAGIYRPAVNMLCAVAPVMLCAAAPVFPTDGSAGLFTVSKSSQIKLIRIYIVLKWLRRQEGGACPTMAGDPGAAQRSAAGERSDHRSSGPSGTMPVGFSAFIE